MKKKWLRRNALTLLILVAFGAAAVWTTMTFNRMPDPPVVKAVTLEAVTDYEITSANELTAYPAGTVFPKNLAAYFYAAGPGVVLYPRVTVSGLDKGELEGTIDYQAELMAADERLGTYWSYGLEAIPPESFRLTPDTRAFTSKGMPLEVQSYYDLALMIREEIDSNAGNIQLRLSATIRVEGTANAVPVKRQTVQTFDLTLRDNSFSVTLPPEENISKITAVPASVPPAFADRLLTFAADNLYLLVLDGVLLLALVLSLVLRDRRASKAEAERKRFKEWISEGTVEVKGKTPIQIVSLEGLVDLAIDLDKRVIYDDAAKRYFVLEEDLLYSHDPLAADGHLEKKPQLGKLLLEKGYIRQEELETGLYYQQQIGSRLGESLIALGFIDETVLHSTLAAQKGINYVEISPKADRPDLSWTEKFDIKQARALGVIPLGQRADGTWVIACGKPATEELKKALEEILGAPVFLVATRPSAVFAALDHIREQEQKNWGRGFEGTSLNIEPFERLTPGEWESFTTAYYRGEILQSLLLKATGIVDPTALAPAGKEASVMDYLKSENIVDAELLNLMGGLGRVVGRMDWNERQEKRVPSIPVLLRETDYLTDDVLTWVVQEGQLQKISDKALLQNNFLASSSTLDKAGLLLDTLKSILGRNPV